MVLPIAGLLMIVAVAILFVRTIWRRRPEPKEGPAPSPYAMSGGDAWPHHDGDGHSGGQ